VSRGLVTKIPLNHEKVCVDKYSIQMLGDTPLVNLVQDGKVLTRDIVTRIFGYNYSLYQLLLKKALLWRYYFAGYTEAFCGLQVNCAAILDRFQPNRIFPTDFHESPCYVLSLKSAKWEPR